MHLDRFRRLSGAIVALLIAVAGASAQDRPQEFDSYVVPGWSFTPGVSISGMWDSNVALAGRAAESGKTDGDNVFTIMPMARLGLESKRTQFSAGYRGYVRRYTDIDELNGYDQRAHLNLRHMVTPRLTLFVQNEFSEMPTTDLTELNGVPFARIGSRSNRLAGGVEGRLTKLTTLRVRYENTWTSFDRLDGFLSGGTIHGFGADVQRRLTERITVGAEGRVRRSDVTRIEPRVIWFRDGGGVVEYRLTQFVAVHGAVGMSHLSDNRFSETRTAPYFRVGIERHTERLDTGLTFENSYMPSFGFSGSNDTQELRGFVRMPLDRNRVYVQADGLWRKSHPFFAVQPGELELDTFVTNVTVGYSPLRWLRTEAYHAYSRQDSIITGGEVDRHRIGAQLVISQPMRIR